MDTNIMKQHTTSKTLVVIYRTTGHHNQEVTIFIFSAMKTSYLTYIYQLPVPTVALQDMTEHFIYYFPVYCVRFKVLLMVSVFCDAVMGTSVWRNHCCTLKMEAAGLSKILVSICQTIWLYISENHTVVSVVFCTGCPICVAHCQLSNRKVICKHKII
jgi:Pyruvate/2-oxoacid:ferredoxin oxidoreductase delta subunit